MVFIGKARHEISGNSLPLFLKYFILLATTAVLSLPSRNENIVASSQSSTTTKQERRSSKRARHTVNGGRWCTTSSAGHLAWKWSPGTFGRCSEWEGSSSEPRWPAPLDSPPHLSPQLTVPVGKGGKGIELQCLEHQSTRMNWISSMPYIWTVNIVNVSMKTIVWRDI